ncbi:hypothetical protein IVB33_29060 [Bradyrhizobium sp. 24]|uniref:hypothetical protein n=1 Tax=unclassified Bradyrhizobium TaxID=2631580 RepID=UPI001FFAA1B3|nr:MULTISPECIES: hypothetical protein [unclassified Bradyrhizobium]MCK1302943.1 hypothetical protein [Bradyrhizobium sp. 37]MCK1381002.1 hypothetical protein [Bradyrhizobium sp. 24]MCK1772439.1 hypothetical protein [Bradyrhizobium sp. 134]
MMSYFKNSVARSLRSKTAAIVYGILLFTPVANMASAADAKVVVDKILGEAIPAIQSQMGSMSEGCSGGSHGRPPESWGALQVHGHTAVNAFSQARTSLATGKTEAAIQQLNSGLGQYDSLINGLHENCSGGAHGEDPQSYGAYVAFRNNLKTQLETALRFL